MQKLPPLTAVRAFEAAARHQSFTRAAEELLGPGTSTYQDHALTSDDLDRAFGGRR